MKRWGLRWIFCWLSVLITAACGQFGLPTPTQNNAERTPTLQNFTPPATASPSPVRPLLTITPPPYSATAMRLATLDPTLDVLLDPPTCYHTAVQSLICLGWAHNPNVFPLINTKINFYLLTPEGHLVQSQSINPVLSVLYGDAGSPYRVVFDEVTAENTVPYVELGYTEKAEATYWQSPPTSLNIQLNQNEWTGIAHQVSGAVYAAHGGQVRVVVTIRGLNNRITGFRVADVLVDDASLQGDFSLEIAPLDGQQGELEVMAEWLD